MAEPKKTMEDGKFARVQESSKNSGAFYGLLNGKKDTCLMEKDMAERWADRQNTAFESAVALRVKEIQAVSDARAEEFIRAVEAGVKYKEKLDAIESRAQALVEALEGIMEAAEFGSMEQSPPGFWDKQIDAAKKALDGWK